MKTYLVVPLLMGLLMGMSKPPSASKNIEFWVVSNVVEMSSSILEREDRFYPWTKDQENIIFGGGDGFRKVVYLGLPKKTYYSPDPKVFDVEEIKFESLVMVSEVSHIRDYIFEKKTLLVTRKWKGKNYIIANYDIQTDKQGKDFISSREFHRTYGGKLQPTDISRGSGGVVGCFDLDAMSKYELSSFKDENFAVLESNLVCLNQGVYLDIK